MKIMEQMTIIENKEIASNIFEMTLSGKLVQQINNPGQFVHIRVSNALDTLLRRPISIASSEREKHEMVIIFRAEGKGTRILSERSSGETVDVLGPLGNGYPLNEINRNARVLIVGGGIGVPPLYELAKQLHKKGIHTTHVLGFQTKQAVFYEEKFAEFGETFITTDDGSYGEHGFVTDVIHRLKQDVSIYFSCGPTPMLRAVSTELNQINGYLSFEERMGCGIGACFACVCKTTDQTEKEYVKICSDGPVFPAGVIAL